MKICLRLAFLFSLVSAARADILWDNWGQASDFSAILVKDSGGLKPDTGEGADDFVLDKAAKVKGATILLFLGNPHAVSLWRIRVYSDENDKPGAELFSTTAEGGNYSRAHDLRLDLAFKEPFKAAAGTKYWLSLQAEYPLVSPPDLRWRESTTLIKGRDAHYRYHNGGTWSVMWPVGVPGWFPVKRKNEQTGADFVWQLTGEPVGGSGGLGG